MASTLQSKSPGELSPEDVDEFLEGLRVALRVFDRSTATAR